MLNLILFLFYVKILYFGLVHSNINFLHYKFLKYVKYLKFAIFNNININ